MDRMKGVPLMGDNEDDFDDRFDIGDEDTGGFYEPDTWDDEEDGLDEE